MGPYDSDVHVALLRDPVLCKYVVQASWQVLRSGFAKTVNSNENRKLTYDRSTPKRMKGAAGNRMQVKA